MGRAAKTAVIVAHFQNNPMVVAIISLAFFSQKVGLNTPLFATDSLLLHGKDGLSIAQRSADDHSVYEFYKVSRDGRTKLYTHFGSAGALIGYRHGDLVQNVGVTYLQAMPSKSGRGFPEFIPLQICNDLTFALVSNQLLVIRKKTIEYIVPNESTFAQIGASETGDSVCHITASHNKITCLMLDMRRQVVTTANISTPSLSLDGAMSFIYAEPITATHILFSAIVDLPMTNKVEAITELSGRSEAFSGKRVCLLEFDSKKKSLRVIRNVLPFEADRNADSPIAWRFWCAWYDNFIWLLLNGRLSKINLNGFTIDCKITVSSRGFRAL